MESVIFRFFRLYVLLWLLAREPAERNIDPKKVVTFFTGDENAEASAFPRPTHELSHVLGDLDGLALRVADGDLIAVCGVRASQPAL